MRVNEQGRSMIEMLGVLAIVGVLSVGGIAGYSKAMNKFKANKAIDQVNMMTTNIRTLFSSQRTYEGLDNGTAIKAGLIPGEMYAVASDGVYASSYTITHALGGTVEINPAEQTNTTDNMAFVISLDELPKTACVSMATTDWGSDAGSGLAAIYVGQGPHTTALTELNKPSTSLGQDGAELVAVPGDDTHGVPVSIVNANLACVSDNNVMAWKYF